MWIPVSLPTAASTSGTSVAQVGIVEQGLVVVEDSELTIVLAGQCHVVGIVTAYSRNGINLHVLLLTSTGCT